jgi:hypothetical protein
LCHKGDNRTRRSGFPQLFSFFLVHQPSPINHHPASGKYLPNTSPKSSSKHPFPDSPILPDPPWQAILGLDNFPPHMFENLTSKQLAKAAALKERIENLEAELSELLGDSSTAAPEPLTVGKKRTMSAAGRARIAAAAKKRWAKFRGSNSDGAAPIEKRRRRMSPAARARIAASAKARWAKAKASGRNAL